MKDKLKIILSKIVGLFKTVKIFFKKIFKPRNLIATAAIIMSIGITAVVVLSLFKIDTSRIEAIFNINNPFMQNDTKSMTLKGEPNGYFATSNENSSAGSGTLVTRALDDDLVIGGSTKLENGSRYYTSDFVVSNGELKLNGYFSDNMMFQQERPIVVWGKEKSGVNVKVKLIRDKDMMVVTQNNTNAENGSFYIRLPKIVGSFNTYTLVIEGSANKKIKNILVGDIWVVGGGDNMEFPVKDMLNSDSEIQSANNNNLRYFQEMKAVSDSSSDFPAEPQFEIDSQFKWGLCSDIPFLKEMSAIGYGLSKELFAKLNVPIGIIDVAVNGTVIESWIARDVLDDSTDAVDYLTRNSEYLKLDEINKSTKISKYNQMTVQYNKRIAPIAGTNVKGIVWYQGESDIAECNSEYYAKALGMLSKCWSASFGRAGQQLPVVFVNIAPYNYIADSIPLLNDKMLKNQLTNKEKFALVATYDLPLEYKSETNSSPLYPIDKAPIASRCAKAALGIAYDNKDEYMSPVFEGAEVLADKIRVKFSHVGSGLKLKDNASELIGFAIAPSIGKFIPASARIISKDTIEVYSPFVKAPKYVSFGFTNFNMDCNLINSESLPALSFVSEYKLDSINYCGKQWTNLTSLNKWIPTTTPVRNDGLQIAWKAGNGYEDRISELSIDNGGIVSGKYALKIKYNNASSNPISVGPTESAINNEKQYIIYSKLTFTVYNPDNREKTFRGIRINSDGKTLVGGQATVIPGKSSVTISIDLWNVKDRNNNPISDISNAYTKMQSLNFEFTDNNDGTLLIHSIVFRT